MTITEPTRPPRHDTAAPPTLGDRITVTACVTSMGAFFGTVLWLAEWSAQ
ncbi:hypothetical protein ACFO5K_04005 [Nocardia halotolerans]|uniref:Uncharacterized protein n=1 Tax=Nocardia halotolerans TaxID=1755878 RepID=A0ABV8VCA4_9NOCA